MAHRVLDERFKGGPPTRGPEDRHAWLTAEEKRFALWALRGQWSAARIGRALGVNEATVRRFRRGFWDHPKDLLELDLFEMVGRASNDEFRCLVCVERVVGRREVERHVVGHFVEESVLNAVLPRPRRRKSQDKRPGRQR